MLLTNLTETIDNYVIQAFIFLHNIHLYNFRTNHQIKVDKRTQSLAR